jgi:hypothetical protein
MCRPAYVGGDDIEFFDFETSSRQAGRLTSFGSTPLLIISQDTDRQNSGMTSDAIAENAVWNREQEALKSLSPISWRVIARGAGHGVQHDRLDVVVSEITQLIAYVRGSGAPPFGRTIIK